MPGDDLYRVCDAIVAPFTPIICDALIDAIHVYFMNKLFIILSAVDRDGFMVTFEEVF